MAPEYIAKGRLTEKVDVYSFGVLVLEIISGVKNTTLESDNYFETLVTDVKTPQTLLTNLSNLLTDLYIYSLTFINNLSLFSPFYQAWKHFQSNTASEIIDESLEIEDVEETKRDIQIGLLCTQAKPALRPSMTKVLQMLRHKDMELPAPTKPPFLDECVELSSSFGFIPGKSQMFNLHRPQDCNYQCL